MVIFKWVRINVLEIYKSRKFYMGEKSLILGKKGG